MERPRVTQLRPEPALDLDFPDPGILAAPDGWYYAYATNRHPTYRDEDPGLGTIQVAASRDLRRWELRTDSALAPALPPGLGTGHLWAPHAICRDGAYLLLFAGSLAGVRHGATRWDDHAIWLARSDRPDGGFVVDPAPLIAAPGGVIDPYVAAIGGRDWLLYKTEGNSIGEPSRIRLRPFGRPGPDVCLLENTESWEGAVVEAPTLVERGGRYWLLYSAGCYATAGYAIGVAVADRPDGPYRKLGPLALPGRRGAGGQDLVEAGGRWYLAYHAWDPAHTRRRLHVDPLEWEDAA